MGKITITERVTLVFTKRYKQKPAVTKPKYVQESEGKLIKDNIVFYCRRAQTLTFIAAPGSLLSKYLRAVCHLDRMELQGPYLTGDG